MNLHQSPTTHLVMVALTTPSALFQQTVSDRAKEYFGGTIKIIRTAVFIHCLKAEHRVGPLPLYLHYTHVQHNAHQSVHAYLYCCIGVFDGQYSLSNRNEN